MKKFTLLLLFPLFAFNALWAMEDAKSQPLSQECGWGTVIEHRMMTEITDLLVNTTIKSCSSAQEFLKTLGALRATCRELYGYNFSSFELPSFEKDELNAVLFKLVKTGNEHNVNTLNFLVTLGADINQFDDSKKTPLMYAAECGAVQLLKSLLILGADLNPHDRDMRRAVDLAAINGHIECVKILAQHGGKESTSGVLSTLPLPHLSVDCLQNRISFFIEPTALHALKAGKHDIVKWLLENGQDVNQPLRGSKSLLMYAAARGDVNMVNLLLEKNAKKDMQDGFNKRAIDYLIDPRKSNDAESVIDLSRPTKGNMPPAPRKPRPQSRLGQGKVRQKILFGEDATRSPNNNNLEDEPKSTPISAESIFVQPIAEDIQRYEELKRLLG